MPCRLLFAFLLGFTIGVALPCGAKLVGQDRVAGWTADIERLLTELPDRHVNLFHNLTEEDFRAEAGRLKQAIPDCDDREMALRMMKWLAAVGDGHTTVEFPREQMNYLPLQFAQFRDGLFVVAAGPEYREALRGRVTRIGSLKVDEALARISGYLSHDNEYQLRSQAPSFVPVAEMLRSIGAWDSTDSGNLEIERDGRLQTLRVSSVSFPEFRSVQWLTRQGATPLYLQKGQFDHWNDWLADSRTLYFKYNRCANADAFNRLVRGTAGFVAQNDVDKFVLDLRDNPGGDSRIFDPLFQFLVQHPQLNREGHLFVIIGRRTFSSAVLNALQMKQTQATFVGEPTGGKPNHYGEVRSLALPYSDLSVSYATKFFQRIADADPPALMPDVQVEATFDDWWQGRDPVLQTILER